MDRMPAIRAMNMMDMAQSSIYAQVTNESRRQIWQGWSNIISRVTHMITNKGNMDMGRSLITWNGEAQSIGFLKQQFARLFGRRSVER